MVFVVKEKTEQWNRTGYRAQKETHTNKLIWVLTKEQRHLKRHLVVISEDGMQINNMYI